MIFEKCEARGPMRAAMLSLLLCACASSAPPAVVAPVCPPQQRQVRAPLASDTDRTLYALGLIMGQRLGDFSLTPEELAVVQGGMTDQVTGATRLVELRRWGEHVNELAHERVAARLTRERERGRAYAAQAEQQPGARRLPSGLIFRELREGNGAHPGSRDVARVHYRGTLVDGTEFDASYDSDGSSHPVEFPLDGVIQCWQEGIPLMTVGSRAVLVCPSEIAYGERGQRGIPPGATLTFEVELLSAHAPEAPHAESSASPAPTTAPPSAPPSARPPASPRVSPRR